MYLLCGLQSDLYRYSPENVNFICLLCEMCFLILVSKCHQRVGLKVIGEKIHIKWITIHNAFILIYTINKNQGTLTHYLLLKKPA